MFGGSFKFFWNRRCYQQQHCGCGPHAFYMDQSQLQENHHTLPQANHCASWGDQSGGSTVMGYSCGLQRIATCVQPTECGLYVILYNKSESSVENWFKVPQQCVLLDVTSWHQVQGFGLEILSWQRFARTSKLSPALSSSSILLTLPHHLVTYDDVTVM